MFRLLYMHESLGSLGGAEANVCITAAELKQRGVTVGLLTDRATGKGEDRWYDIFGDNIFWKSRDSLTSIRTRFQPDVVYVHKWADLPTLTELVDSGLPLARMVHDHDIYCLRSYRYNPITRTVCRRPASGYCVFPCVAPLKFNRQSPLKLSWVSYFDKLKELALTRRFDRMFVVTRYMRHELEINGFDPTRIEIFPPVPRPGEPLEPSFSDRNLILYAGQIVRGKGVDLLLRALARVKTPFEAVILGDGNHKRACQKLCRRLGLDDRVRFAGFIPQDELKAYYRDASLVAVSSVWPEPIATIGLEVMRYALPVVAFDAGGIPDWLHHEHTGLLVPWGDIDAYASSIDRLLTDKSLARQLGANGRTYVNEHYDFDAYLARLTSTLQALGTSRQAPPPLAPS